MTPIEELTALEMAESARSRALAVARHKAELGVAYAPVSVVVAPLVVAPSLPTPVAIPTAIIGKPDLTPSFLRHLVDEVKDELMKEGE